MYYGRKGEPLDVFEWSRRHDDLEYRRVGYDEIPSTHSNPASFLSTVWLGIDHNFLGGGPPIIFETMRFIVETHTSELFPKSQYHSSLYFPDPDDPASLTEQVRYHTEEEASLAHRRIMQAIREQEMV